MGNSEKNRSHQYHENNSALCLKYQYEYFRLNLNDKRKYANRLLYISIWRRLFRTLCCCEHEDCHCCTDCHSTVCSNASKIIFNVLMSLYILARVYVAILFPFAWYFYLYVHQRNQDSFCASSNIECTQNVFVTALMALYF